MPTPVSVTRTTPLPMPPIIVLEPPLVCKRDQDGTHCAKHCVGASSCAHTHERDQDGTLAHAPDHRVGTSSCAHTREHDKECTLAHAHPKLLDRTLQSDGLLRSIMAVAVFSSRMQCT